MIKPYYEQDGITIYNADALFVMRALPDASIDLIATDPPYFKVKSDAWDNQWDMPEKFLAWIGELCAEWKRILKPNGSLYCFASPQMGARVESQVRQYFNVLNFITWAKPAFSTKAEMFDKATCRTFFPASERIIFAEHFGADNIAKGEAGYAAKCDELRGFVFEPLRAYLDGERERAGFTVRQVAEAFQKKTGSRTVTGMAGHWFTSVQWTLPTEENYNWLRTLLSGDFLRREYEDLRREYEDLRREYEDLRRPFNATPDAPYTDVWSFATVPAFKSKHVCEKPLALMEHILSVSGKRGCLVLDCFAGSGTTLQGAKNLGMRAIGVDLGLRNCQIAADRLRQQTLFGEIA